MFIVAYKKKQSIDAEVLKKYPFIQGLMQFFEGELNGINGYRDDLTVRVNTLEDLIEYCLTWKTDKFYVGTAEAKENILLIKASYAQRKGYKKAKELLNNGYKLIMKDVGYNDCTLRNLMQAFPEGLDENFFIFEEDLKI